MRERLARIQRKLEAAGKRLRPPLTEAGLDLYERSRAVSLPAEYRAFVLQLGDGGDGPPFYGLAALGDLPAGLTADEKVQWSDPTNMAKPFPFTRAWVWEEGDISDEGTHEQVAWGTLYLGDDGCGMYWHLIVTGPDRGNVWQLCGEGIQPTAPKRDFLRWYEDWLDGVEDWWDAAVEGGPTSG